MTLDAILLEKKPARLIDRLHMYVTEPDIGGVAPEDLIKAPPLIKGTIYLSAFDLTTVNSGIWKWFVELYDDYPDFTDFLRRIKADRTADYILASEALFPKKRVPKHVDERFDFCADHGPAFQELDKQFKGAAQIFFCKIF